VVLDEEQDGTAWGVFQEVRGAWERIHATMRDALHPAMRRLAFFQSFELIFIFIFRTALTKAKSSALALRILAVRRAEAAFSFGSSNNTLASQSEMTSRAEESIILAAKGLGNLRLELDQSGGVLGLLDALHVLLSTLPLLAASKDSAQQCHWLQQLVQIPAIEQASVAEAELAINHVTMNDKMGSSSPLRRALAVALISALCRRLNSNGPNCWRQLSIISKNLAGALKSSRSLCGGASMAMGLGGGNRNPIHLPTTTSVQTRAGKSVLGGGLVRALEAGDEDEEQGRANLCHTVCVSATSQLLLYFAPILSKQLQHSAATAAQMHAGHAGVTLESSFLVTGLRALLEEVSTPPLHAPHAASRDSIETEAASRVSAPPLPAPHAASRDSWPRACAAKALEQLFGNALDVWHCLPLDARAEWVSLIVAALERADVADDGISPMLLVRALDSNGSMAALSSCPHRMSRALSVLLGRLQLLAVHESPSPPLQKAQVCTPPLNLHQETGVCLSLTQTIRHALNKQLGSFCSLTHTYSICLNMPIFILIVCYAKCESCRAYMIPIRHTSTNRPYVIPIFEHKIQDDISDKGNFLLRYYRYYQMCTGRT
jgi:hypothetical protein